jgi:hypothetical protein
MEEGLGTRGGMWCRLTGDRDVGKTSYMKGRQREGYRP